MFMGGPLRTVDTTCLPAFSFDIVSRKLCTRVVRITGRSKVRLCKKADRVIWIFQHAGVS